MSRTEKGGMIDMEERVIRSQLEEVQRELRKNEEEHEILLSLMKGLEGWLRLRGAKPTPSPQLTMAVTEALNKPKGTISLRSGVLQVLKEARGEPLHCREIYTRVQLLGGSTSAKSPESVVDLTIFSLRKTEPQIDKVAPRTYRWVNGDSELVTART